MNILNPTPGQLFDRLIILELKIAVQRAPHFVAEHDAIRERLAAQALAKPLPHDVEIEDRVLYTYCMKLRQIHRALWQHQAEVAEAAKDPNAPPNDLGVILFRLNQDRVGQIETIDKLLGEYTGPEKLYT